MENENIGYVERLRTIAQEVELKNYDLFVKFMIRRFPGEQHESYIGEWATRFKSGDPVGYMDNESKQIYISLL